MGIKERNVDKKAKVPRGDGKTKLYILNKMGELINQFEKDTGTEIIKISITIDHPGINFSENKKKVLIDLRSPTSAPD